MNIKERIKHINSYIPALYLSLKSKRTPFVAKFFALFTICYALSPIDLIPDFIPFFGFLDDLLILPLCISLTIKFIPKEVFAEFLEQTKDQGEEGLAKHWYYAVPIVIFYILLIFIIVKAIWF